MPVAKRTSHQSCRSAIEPTLTDTRQCGVLVGPNRLERTADGDGELHEAPAGDHQAILREHRPDHPAKLSELVTDLYLAEGKKRDKLWETATRHMEKLGSAEGPHRLTFSARRT